MSTNKVLLDVDRSIIENNLLIKEIDSPLNFASPNEELERLFPLPRSSEEPSKVIQLTPGVCVKTRDKDDNKVFINLCTAAELPPPPDVGEAQLLAILDSEDPSLFRVPMCLGEPRFETDKSGNSCKVFDVAVNPVALARLRSSDLFRQFLCTATLEGLQSKYDVELNVADVTLLTKRKSMGNPRSQRIRTSSSAGVLQPLIAEICPAQAQDLKPRIRVPKYRIKGEPSAGQDLQRMMAEISLPDVTSASELDVDIGEDRMVVKGRLSGYTLDVFLPHLVQQESARAQFNRDTQVLTLTLPVKPGQ